MINVGNFNFDNAGLQPNIVPKVTATTGISTLSPSLLTDDGTTLKYNGKAIAASTGINVPTVLYSAAGTPLPVASNALKGASAIVSDATTPTYGAAYVSGGAVVARVLCTGVGGWVTA